MATTLTVELTDDLNGAPGASTVEFAIGGKHYAIDLAPANHARLLAVTQEFVGKARRVQPGRKRAASAHAGDAHLIRAWAQANGWDVAARGRIPSEIRAAYREAHQKTAA